MKLSNENSEIVESLCHKVALEILTATCMPSENLPGSPFMLTNPDISPECISCLTYLSPFPLLQPGMALINLRILEVGEYQLCKIRIEHE